MTVISSNTNADELTLTLIAEFDAPPERVWDVWEDARKLERWWGPPTYPATFTRHEFVVGGQCRYYMTGPEGRGPGGWWRIDALEKPRLIEFANGFAGDDGEPAPGVPPAAGIVTLEPTDTGTRMTTLTRFVSVEQMDRMLGMGMQEGMGLAIGQIDALLEPVVA
ncbi:MAG TPA: SRPBCC domain-containing protein [Solirubrobacteraceae bacterium]|nr:SRPBCC domain-containing protein [Solirubrobacteraceae bacterium]